jgi:Ni/Co efflux regulator RcnB
MKSTTILCTAIAATMGLGTLAQAQDTRQERREARQEARQDDRQERRQDARQERRQEARQDARQEQRRDRVEARRVPNFVNTPLANVRDPEPYQRHYNQQAPQRHYNNNYAPQRHYNNAPNYYNHGYNQGYHQGYNRGYAPGYYANNTPRFYRGGYLPHSYRQPTYFVANWNAYPSLYAPPYGHQWVQVGNDFLLVAVTTGLIAHMLTM